jgi:hypothetical protein
MIDRASGVVVGVIVAKLKGDQQLVNYGVKSGHPAQPGVVRSEPAGRARGERPEGNIQDFARSGRGRGQVVGLIIVNTDGKARNLRAPLGVLRVRGPSKFEVVAVAMANYEKGMAAYKEKRYSDALLLLGKSGEAGNQKAQAMVGVIVRGGKGGLAGLR